MMNDVSEAYATDVTPVIRRDRPGGTADNTSCRTQEINAVFLIVISLFLFFDHTAVARETNRRWPSPSLGEYSQQQQNMPWLVYRADQRDPVSLKHADGFQANYTRYNRLPVYSLYYHVLGFLPQTTPFISTTEDFTVARGWISGGERSYIYAIRPESNFISTAGTLGRFNPFPAQQEWAALETIPWRNVVGWYVFDEGQVQHIQQNPDYLSPRTRSGEIPRPVYSRADIAGFPVAHEALNEEPWKSGGTSCVKGVAPSYLRLNPDIPPHPPLSDRREAKATDCSHNYASVQGYLTTLHHTAPTASYSDQSTIRSAFAYGEHHFISHVMAFNLNGEFLTMELPEQGNQGVGASKLTGLGGAVNDMISLRNAVFENGFDATLLVKDTQGTASHLLAFRKQISAEYDVDEHSGRVGMFRNTAPVAVRFPFLKGTIFQDGIDAAFRVPGSDWAYFSRGKQGAFVNLKEGFLLSVKPITEEWPLLLQTPAFADGFDAAFCVVSPYAAEARYFVYFFRGHQYRVISFVMSGRAGAVSQLVRGGGDMSGLQAFRQAHW